MPRTLTEMLNEALYTPNNVDACKENVIRNIADYCIDFAIGNNIRSNSKDEKFNELVDNFTTSYYNLVRYLEREGLIRINGVQVSKVLNK